MTHTTPRKARELANASLVYIEARTKAREALHDLADQVEALTAERDSYKKDAERYRWLKANPFFIGWRYDIVEGLDVDVDSAIKGAAT